MKKNQNKKIMKMKIRDKKRLNFQKQKIIKIKKKGTHFHRNENFEK